MFQPNRLLKGLFVLLVSFLLSGCLPNPSVIKQEEADGAEEGVAIYVVRHGWHTGIVVPAGKLQSMLPQLKEQFGNTPYLEFGWGDNKYYQAEQVTIELTIRAILWPTESVIHAVALPEKADIFFPNSRVEKLCITGAEYARLIRYLITSFHKDKNNNIVPIGKGIYGNSQFYRAEGKFYFLNTCNTWTAKALTSAGVKITPSLSITANNVMNAVRDLNESDTTMSPERARPATFCN